MLLNGAIPQQIYKFFIQLTGDPIETETPGEMTNDFINTEFYEQDVSVEVHLDGEIVKKFNYTKLMARKGPNDESLISWETANLLGM